MPKKNKIKTTTRRAFRATKTALQQFAVAELVGTFRRRENFDVPGLNCAPFQFCALALKSK